MTAMTTARTSTAEDHLRTVLRVDSVVTGAAGLFALLAPTSTWGDVPGWVPRALGAGFLLAALFLAIETRGTCALKTIGTLCMEAAFAWVVASVAILALVDLTTRGELVVGLVGLATLAFGITELRLLRAPRPRIPARG